MILEPEILSDLIGTIYDTALDRPVARRLRSRRNSLAVGVVALFEERRKQNR
jgi:hypothetical protein